MKYGLLHYRGDVTGAAVAGQLLGCDEVFRPYVITDAEYQPEVDMTTVWVQTASGDEIKAASR